MRSTFSVRAALAVAVVVAAVLSHKPAAAQRGDLLGSVAQAEGIQPAEPKTTEPNEETTGRRPPLFVPVDEDENDPSSAVDGTEEEGPTDKDDAAALTARLELIERQIEEFKKELSFLRAEIRELKAGGATSSQVREQKHRTAPFWLVE